MRFEIRKFFRRKETWIVLVIGTIAMVLLVFRSDRADTVLMKEYRTKIAEFTNLSYQDAQSKIEEQIASLPADASDLHSPQYNTYVVLGNLLESTRKYAEHEAHLQSNLEQWEKKAETAKTDYSKKNYNKAFSVYNRAHQYLVCNTMDTGLGLMNLEDTSFQYLYLLLILALFSPLFSSERESGMYQLLFPSKRGKSCIYLQKIAASSLLILLLTVCGQMMLFILIWCKRGLSLHLLMAPLQSFQAFENCPFSLNIMEYALLRGVFSALAGECVLAVIAFLSVFFQRTLVVFFLSGLVSFGLSLSGIDSENSSVFSAFLHRSGGIQLLKAETYLTHYETVNVFGIPVWQILLTVIMTISVCLLLYALGWVGYSMREEN